MIRYDLIKVSAAEPMFIMFMLFLDYEEKCYHAWFRKTVFTHSLWRKYSSAEKAKKSKLILYKANTDKKVKENLRDNQETQEILAIRHRTKINNTENLEQHRPHKKTRGSPRFLSRAHARYITQLASLFENKKYDLQLYNVQTYCIFTRIYSLDSMYWQARYNATILLNARWWLYNKVLLYNCIFLV